eukprot:TRINITY_DN11415_c0_g1_i2.p2 TRINITY_DN11415_c0_g1~~TRINITY_DN11415_c0_g1_i2.p2  ORF type:complete len:163 (+),score=4.91 TRINITY_DN11415_c0_g1_i2:168-656(+)
MYKKKICIYMWLTIKHIHIYIYFSIQKLFSNVQAVNTAEKLAEIVMQVDQNDQEVGPISRAEVRKNYLWHRASCIFLVNSKNEFCCHLRHRNKVWCPHHWTTAFGGVVGYNETYDSNAYKAVSYTHLRAHETRHDLVCRLLLEKKNSFVLRILHLRSKQTGP